MTVEELKRFCAGLNDIRTYLMEPFSIGPWTYATNGHIIVRVPRLPEVLTMCSTFAGKIEIESKIESMFSDQQPADGWMPVPVVEMPEASQCYDCDGKGCDECSGVGSFPSSVGMDVGNSHYQQRYIALLQGWEINPQGPVPDPDIADTHPAFLRNGEATGLLMPRKK